MLPPAPVGEVVLIAADHDPAGLTAAEQAAARFEAEGRLVTIITPPTKGTDFNDLLQQDSHE
ncbi:toprim domain-containing protein [Pseudaestuariivita rosea]|uniref:toprim domain-containing protein n=1 Tax=Pseudaestuariivita rosea TaxID=2763263 RepID=UPI001ABADEA8|nr:toprim domain-containing protein [Pseudaestuariivita rosea]